MRVNTNNGAAGWIRGGAGPARDMRTDELAVRQAAGMPSSLRAGFKTLLTGLESPGAGKISEHTRVGGPRNQSATAAGQKLFFDQATSLSAQRAVSAEVHTSAATCSRIDYDNYYITNGVRMPMTWTINGPRENKIIAHTIDTVQVSPVEDSKICPAGEIRPRSEIDSGELQRVQKGDGAKPSPAFNFYSTALSVIASPRSMIPKRLAHLRFRNRQRRIREERSSTART